jgi:hypothetical protein
VRCQSEALAHHASTLAAARRAVNRKSELNELRAEVARSGLSDLTESIVKGLYEAGVSRLAKSISDPLADWLFRPSSVRAEAVTAKVAKIAALAEKPVFDETALPDNVRNPIILSGTTREPPDSLRIPPTLGGTTRDELSAREKRELSDHEWAARKAAHDAGELERDPGAMERIEGKGFGERMR